MKITHLFLTTAIAVLISSVGTQSLRAEDIAQGAAPTISAVTGMPATGDAASTFPGIEIGIVGAGTPVTGVPCFACPTANTLTIPVPASVLTHGTAVQLFYTVQLTTVSGTGPVTLELIQAKKVIFKSTGNLTFNPNSVYVVNSGAGTVPNKPGAAILSITMTLGTSTAKAHTTVYIQ